VSVRRAEPDPQQFWASVIDAIRAAVASEYVGPLAATPDFNGDAVVERLRSELEAVKKHLVLVIDDVHELSSTDALRQLERFLEELSAGVSVVLVVRGEVRLRLHRLRLVGRLTELRAADLAFTLEQTHEVLAASGVELSDAGVRAVHERTEGWAAGVRLATLSLSNHPVPARFLAEFSGTERTVAEYLLGEVLDRQPAEVRALLLRTSVLERVSGPLADALTGASGSEATLRALQESGAFVVALDSGQTWFRYHQLLADLLRLELRRSAPEAVPQLHRIAADWFGAHGHVVEAIAHAQAAGDWRHAVGLLADDYFSLTLDGRQATARGLLQSFPRDAMSADPELALMLGADEVAQGSLDTAAAAIALAKRHAQMVPPERRRRFEVGLALVRLSLARRRGDFESVVDLIRALALRIPARGLTS
jgi:LuxR family transcriptional regulator, maltose regulon positive regulatory protein